MWIGQETRLDMTTACILDDQQPGQRLDGGHVAMLSGTAHHMAHSIVHRRGIDDSVKFVHHFIDIDLFNITLQELSCLYSMEPVLTAIQTGALRLSV